ncbi:MAG: HAMP domain-containing sensor histidine kinase [Rhodospirillales bacterium]
MNLSRFFKSSAFRFAVIYMVLFGTSVCGVLGFEYWQTARVIGTQTDTTIEVETQGLAEHYREFGLAQLIFVIKERARNNPNLQSIYLLTSADYTPLAGNLSAWPAQAKGAPAWFDFRIETTDTKGNKVERPARAQTFLLPDRFHLLVGREMTERQQFQALITNALFWGLVLTLALGLLGGVLMSRHVLARIEVINRGSRAILDGDLQRRMPITGSGDEFDRLSENLNAMLDQIERLMAGMRGVTNDIAHDLRSPINRLRSRLEITLMEKPGLDEMKAVMEDTIEEADAILETFNATLDIALAESGVLRDKFETVNLSEIVHDAAELYEPVAAEKNEILLCVPGKNLSLKGNRHLLFRALVNLLDNAIKYAPENGTISIEASESKTAVTVAIADNGPGIPPEQREQALKRFTRLEASRSAPGSGLGLALVAAIVRLHAADLRLEDNGPGLRVVLTFPKTQ